MLNNDKVQELESLYSSNKFYLLLLSDIRGNFETDSERIEFLTRIAKSGDDPIQGIGMFRGYLEIVEIFDALSTDIFNVINEYACEAELGTLTVLSEDKYRNYMNGNQMKYQFVVVAYRLAAFNLIKQVSKEGENGKS